MGADDWFRRPTWTAADRDAFDARLRRSRSNFHKAQYLRIQAAHLAEVGTPVLHEAALELLARLIRDHPEPSELASAHQQRGASLRALGRADEAIAAYEAAVDAQNRFPNVRTLAGLELAETLVALDRRSRFRDALDALESMSDDELVPVIRFRAATARALVCDALDEPDAAKKHALDALDAASRTESPFRWHPTFGLVGAVSLDLRARLEQLARRGGRRG